MMRILTIALLATTAVAAQCSLTTTFASNNAQSGAMFDVVVPGNTAVQVLNLDGHFSPGILTIEIYAVANGGSFVGVERNAQAWSLLATHTLTTAGAGLPTPLPLPAPLTIPAGATQGFYVTLRGNSGGVTRYTSGPAVGTVVASDSNLRILSGVGSLYPFAGTVSNRVWNGTVHYRTLRSECPATTFQMNQQNAILHFNGVESNGREPAIARTAAGAPNSLTVDSPLSLPWDIGITSCPPLAFGQGGVRLPSGTQVVNTNFQNASFRWFGDGRFIQSPLFFGLPFGLGFQAGPESFSMQLAILDPSSPDAVTLSQTAYLAVAASPIAMPTGDDAFMSVSLVSAPTCVGPMTFAGTTFTEVFVSTNGRITFGAGSTLYAPVIATALSGAPFFGYWSDFRNDFGAGQVRSDGVSELTFEYLDVVEFGTNVLHSFELALDTRTGEVRIQRLRGTRPLMRVNFLGLSAGNLGAIDAGEVTTFQPGSTGMSTDGSMIYIWNPPGARLDLGQLDAIHFTPLGGLDYRYQAF